MQKISYKFLQWECTRQISGTRKEHPESRNIWLLFLKFEKNHWTHQEITWIGKRPYIHKDILISKHPYGSEIAPTSRIIWIKNWIGHIFFGIVSGNLCICHDRKLSHLGSSLTGILLISRIQEKKSHLEFRKIWINHLEFYTLGIIAHHN